MCEWFRGPVRFITPERERMCDVVHAYKGPFPLSEEAIRHKMLLASETLVSLSRSLSVAIFPLPLLRSLALTLSLSL